MLLDRAEQHRSFATRSKMDPQLAAWMVGASDAHLTAVCMYLKDVRDEESGYSVTPLEDGPFGSRSGPRLVSVVHLRSEGLVDPMSIS